jgi:uracil-DNA glycosylase family 4
MTKKEELSILREKMEKADLPLKRGATRLVFGDGSEDADIVFIGEGPGYWEDQKGVPFVGNAGALLNQMLTAINLKREDVFITNVVHYRPPNNRDPEPGELAAFRPYLDKMIEIIDPKIIVTLGRFSMGKFIPGVMISAVHGKPRVVTFAAKKVVVFPMYHPAAGLRNGEIKLRIREDFYKLKDTLDNKLMEKEAPLQLGLV